MLLTKLEKRTKGLGPQLLTFLWLFWSRSIDLSWGFLVLCSLLLAVSLFLLNELWFTTCLLKWTLGTSKVGKRRRISWWDGAAGLFDPDLVQDSCALQNVHPKYGRVCIIHRINTMCLPRWLIFCHQLTKKHYSYIEANMDLLRHKLQNLQEF